MTNQTYKGKFVFMEVIRVIAALMVIFNHTDNRAFWLYAAYSVKSFSYWICLLATLLCRMAVPLYYMVTGALMLKRDPEPTVKWLKHIGRFALILVVFSLVYYLHLIIPTGTPFDLKAMILMMYDGAMSDHLWFLYSYIGLLVALPFLQAMVRSLDNKYFYILIGVSVVFAKLVPCAEYILFQNEHLLQESLLPRLVVPTIVYPLVGYFIEQRLSEEQVRKFVLPAWILAFCEMLISALTISCLYIREGEVTGDAFQYTKWHLLTVIAIFISVKYLFMKRKAPDRLCAVICELGACTFGIYLTHRLFLDRPWMYAVCDGLVNIGCYPLIAGIVYTLADFAVTFVMIAVLRRIPVVKKLIGG